MKSLFEQQGGTYSMVDGYQIPSLTLPDEPEYEIGRFGLMRRHYLKNHRQGLFTTLLMSGKLNEHLTEIDQIANERFWFITEQLAKSEGVTEDLKASDPIKWIGCMTNLRNRVEEIIKDELIYS